MKCALLTFVALTLWPAHDALARDCVNTSCCESPARWAERHDPRDARLAITTEGDEAMLVLTDEVVAVQLSDRVLRKVRRELRREQDEDADNVIAHAIKTVVLSGVRALLDHSAECPIRDLRDVDYRQGRLIFTTVQGHRVFDDIDVNDEDVMRGFSESDARAFVREFRRVKGRMR